MKFLDWLLRRKNKETGPKKPDIPETRSSKDGEDLTQFELNLIYGQPDGKLHCPDCGSHLYGGPCGGMSQNCLCKNCGSEFNVCEWGGHLMGERISDKGECSAGRQKDIYGVTNESKNGRGYTRRG